MLLSSLITTCMWECLSKLKEKWEVEKDKRKSHNKLNAASSVGALPELSLASSNALLSTFQVQRNWEPKLHPFVGFSLSLQVLYARLIHFFSNSGVVVYAAPRTRY